MTLAEDVHTTTITSTFGHALDQIRTIRQTLLAPPFPDATPTDKEQATLAVKVLDRIEADLLAAWQRLGLEPRTASALAAARTFCMFLDMWLGELEPSELERTRGPFVDPDRRQRIAEEVHRLREKALPGLRDLNAP